MIHSEVFPNRKTALFFSSVFFSLGLVSVSSFPWKGYVNFALCLWKTAIGGYTAASVFIIALKQKL